MNKEIGETFTVTVNGESIKMLVSLKTDTHIKIYSKQFGWLELEREVFELLNEPITISMGETQKDGGAV